MKFRQLAMLALVAAGTVTAGAAHARDNVQWSITLASPFGLPLPPVPVPVAVVREPVYLPPPVYAPPPPRYHGPPPRSVYYAPPPPPPRGHYRHEGWRDADRDGIPDRYDRVYNPRWDRDGDGVPNRQDRHPDRPGRR